MAEIKRIEAMGVNIYLNHKVDDVAAEMTKGNYDAAFIAVGAHIGKGWKSPPEMGQILDAVSLLKQMELGEAPNWEEK